MTLTLTMTMTMTKTMTKTKTMTLCHEFRSPVSINLKRGHGVIINL